MSRRGWFAAAVLLLALAGAVAWRLARTSHLGAVERGRRVAEASGCFGCHGPGGATGLLYAADGISVPSFSNDDVRQYARNEGEIREWIEDGAPRRLREQEDADEEMEPALLVMPAFRGRLDDDEISDLVQYVKAASDFDSPPEGPALEGREAARRLGCFSCHGPQGRGALPNPGSFKGYIPPWDGEDYEDLVRDEAELHAWVLDGAPERLRENRFARFFLDRQIVRMPAYRRHISDTELKEIAAYIRWLRTPRE